MKESVKFFTGQGGESHSALRAGKAARHIVYKCNQLQRAIFTPRIPNTAPGERIRRGKLLLRRHRHRSNSLSAAPKPPERKENPWKNGQDKQKPSAGKRTHPPPLILCRRQGTRTPEKNNLSARINHTLNQKHGTLRKKFFQKFSNFFAKPIDIVLNECYNSINKGARA